MGGIDGPGQPIVGHRGHLAGLRLGEPGVGGHDADRRVGSPGKGEGLFPQPMEVAADFPVLIPGSRQNLTRRGIPDFPQGIDRHDRSDDQAVFPPPRRRTQPSFHRTARPGHLPDGGAATGADIAQGKGTPGRYGGGPITHFPVGTNLPIADIQIEQDRRRDDRNHPGSRLKSAALLLQVLHDTAGGVQAIGAAPGETDGVNSLHQMDGIQQVRLPGSRGRSANIDAADSPLFHP